jgi:hypothetical protein
LYRSWCIYIATKPLFRWHCLVVFWAYQLEISLTQILSTFESSLGSRKMPPIFYPLRRNCCAKFVFGGSTVLLEWPTMILIITLRNFW